MNTSEMRLFVLGLQDVKPHIKDGSLYDVEFRETRISSSELRELFLIMRLIVGASAALRT